MKQKSHISRTLIVLLMTFALIVALGATATAATYNWTGTTSAAWATNTNWNPVGIPGSAVGDIVQIGVVSFTGSQPTLSVAPANALASITLGTATNATLTISAAISFTVTGAVTINAGSTWTETAAATPTFQGGITNSGTFTASTGVHTFNTNSQALTGTFTISSVTVTGAAITLTNNNSLTIGTALAGTGILLNSATGTLALGGTCSVATLTNNGIVTSSGTGTTTSTTVTNNLTFNMGSTGTVTAFTNTATGVLNISAATVPTITTLNVVAVGNTVNYSGAGAQIVIDVAYYNLSTSGSGTKTWTLAAGRVVGGILTVGSGTNLTTAGNQTLGVTGATNVTGTLTLGGTSGKTFTGDVTLNAGAVWSETGIAAYSIGGSFTNNATTFTANTGTHTFIGAANILSGATTTSIPTATFTGTYTNSGTLTCATLLTVTGVTLTNNGTINATTALAGGTGTLLNGATGTLTLGGTCSIATLTNNGIVTSSGAGTTTSGTVTNNLTFNMGSTGTVTAFTNAATGVLNITSTPAVATITTLNVAAVGNTVNYTGAGAQTVATGITFYNLGLSGSGAKTMTGVTTITNNFSMSGSATATTVITTVGGNVNISGTAVMTTGSNLAITGTLTIGSGSGLTTGATFTLGVTSTTSVTGTFTLAGTGAKTFTGDVTLNSGAVWSETGVATYSIGGSFTNNATTFTANTGTHTFIGAANILSGATTTSIPTATFTGTYTNSGTLTCATLLTVTGVTLTNNGTINATTALAGTGTLLNGATGTLTLGGTCSIATLTNNGIVTSSGAGTTTSGTVTNNLTFNMGSTGTVTAFTNAATGVLNITSTPAVATITTLNVAAVGNTVNYTGAGAQTVATGITFYNLGLSGSGAKTMTGVTVTNILDMAGTSTATVAPTYGSAATLQYDQTVTAGLEWITPFVATGGVIINSGTVTLGVAKVIGNNTSVPLKIVSSATLTPGTYLLTFDGDFINAGTLTSGTGGVTIDGTTATQSIAGFTTTGSVSCTKTSGTATISGAVSAVNLTVSGGGTLVLSGSNTFSGTRTLTTGTLVLANTAALGAAGTALTLSGGTLDLAINASVNAYNITMGGSATIASDKATAASAGIIHTLGTLSIGAYTLTIAGGSNVTSGTAGVTFGAITHTAAPKYTVNNPAVGGVTQLSLGAVTNSTYLTTFNGSGNVIQTGVFGNGSGGITYSGTGTLTLNQANTFTGGTTLNSGTLRINNASALGTVAGTFVIAGGTIDNSNGGAITTVNYPLTLSSDFSFIGSNNLNLGSGTVTMNASHQITISGNTLTIGGTLSAGSYNLTIAGAGVLGFGANAVTLNGLTISSGTLVSTSSTMSLAGNFSNSGTFTANGGTVNLNGAATQTIGGSTATSFNKLTINNSTGIVLGVNTTVAGTLTFTSGTITTNAYSLAVSSTGTVSRTSGYVIGNLNRYFATGATSNTFDIGDASAYTPVTVSFANVTTAGSLTASTTTGDHPQILTSGLNSSKTANRYWTLTNSGIVFTTYNVVFTFVSADLDPSAVPASFSVARYNSGTWSTPTIGTRTSTTTQATGIAGFGDFQLGNIQVSGVANYAVQYITTGVQYNSIATTGIAVESWRTTNISDNSYYDDNRSYPVPIGFDFWYDGKRYTQFSASTNGFMDFDTSSWNGGSGALQQYNPYGPYSTDFVDPTRSASSGGVGTVTALAPFYFDLTTWQTTVPLGNSVKYQVDSTAPNRILTVEWINMSCWVETTDILNFQVKLHESTGVIEFCYGNMSGTIALEANFGYVTGINGPSISPNPPTAAQLLCLQTAKTNSFSNTQQYQLLTMPQSITKYTFTPNIPATPTSLNFPIVASNSMTLTWNDVADNELGYAIYRSDDGGVTYSFIRQLVAGSTSSNESGLVANTTYYWKVYAFTEGGLSSALSGNKATLPAASFTSKASTNWNTPSTWVQNSVPTTNSDVTIADGTIVKMDVNASLNSLTVGQGSSGTLHIGGDDGAARTLTVTGNITINNNATLDINTTLPQTGHAVTLSGNLINNGILNLGLSTSNAAGITLNKPYGTQTISGNGTTTNFYTMNVNVGSTSSDILEVTSSHFSSLSAGFLTLITGTFKLSTSANIIPFSGSPTIPSLAGMWINNLSAVVSTIGGDLSVAGILHITTGTLNIGNAPDNRLVYSGGTITIEGGAVNVAGRIERANLTTVVNFNMSGGVLTVPTYGSTSTTVSPIELTVAGSTFTWSNGSIIVQQEGGSGASDLGYLNTLTNFTVTGGTLQIGGPSTPVAQTMNINSFPYIYNILVNNTNATAILVGNETILNNMTVTSGALQTALNDTVSFSGTTPQNITSISPIIFNYLALNNSAGLSISNPITVTCTLTLTNGALSVGANTLTFQTSDNPIARTSGTITTTTSSNLVFGTSGNTGGAAFTIPVGTFTIPPFINNFTINRTNSLTLNNQMMSLSGILLCNGPLNTNGNLTLLSTSTQTALIDGSGSGQVSGNVTMQRYLPSVFGYKYISSPFQGATVGEFSSYLNLGASFPTFYQYNENMTSSGWVNYTTATNLLNPMQGYAANFGPSAIVETVAVAGVVNNGSLSTTLYNHNQPYTSGFNLVGNPYPSPINWDDTSGWTKTNIDNALYYFQASDQYTGTYSTYINGISSDGMATNIIPSMQGFFVHVSNGSYPVTGTLGITDSVRINDLTHALLKSVKTDTLPLLRITAGFTDNGATPDPAVIYFDSSATQSFDKNLDALKLMNTNVLVPNLYTMIADSSRLSIIAIPFPVDSIKRIPLGIKTAKDGWITFKANNIVQIPAKRYIYLVDTVAGISQDLRLNPQYSFLLKAGEYKNRFSLVFSLNVLNNIPTEFSLLQNFPNPFNPRTTIRYLIPHTSFVSITVYDILGKEVSKLVNEQKLPGTYEVQFDGSGLSSGVYFYRIHAGNYFKTKKSVLLK